MAQLEKKWAIKVPQSLNVKHQSIQIAINECWSAKYRRFPVPFCLFKLSAVHSHFANQYRHIFDQFPDVLRSFATADSPITTTSGRSCLCGSVAHDLCLPSVLGGFKPPREARPLERSWKTRRLAVSARSIEQICGTQFGILDHLGSFGPSSGLGYLERFG